MCVPHGTSVFRPSYKTSTSAHCSLHGNQGDRAYGKGIVYGSTKDEQYENDGKEVIRVVDPSLWLLPLVGAFIGWVTNIIAIRMLFYPKHPVRIPFTSLTLQGVLPSRHADLAASVGRAVSEELCPSQN